MRESRASLRVETARGPRHEIDVDAKATSSTHGVIRIVVDPIPAMPVADLPDPRAWPVACAPRAVALHRTAQAAIDAGTGRGGDVAAAEARTALQRLLSSDDGLALGEAYASAPSVPVARYLWHLLEDAERDASSRTTLHTVLAALPVIVISALDATDGRMTLSGVVPDPRALEALLRDEREFGGAQTFALSPTLVGGDVLEPRLPHLLASSMPQVRDGNTLTPLDFAPSPIDVEGGSERVHLRFIMAAVLAAPGGAPLRETSIARWGMPFAQALARQLAASGMSLLALPRPPRGLVGALQEGRAAQREVSAQLFASNAIRRLRASVGEPTAIVSAHRAADAPGGGELRLSLSSPFAPREAEGFRCPLYPYEPVQDVAAMLVALLRDCRVTDVRVRAGVHADADPTTGGPLLFKDTGAAPDQPWH